jgi:hypothetical protein
MRNKYDYLLFQMQLYFFILSDAVPSGPGFSLQVLISLRSIPGFPLQSLTGH